MKSRDTGAQDRHRLLREVLTDSVEEAEYDGITGHLSIKTGPGELTLSGSPDLMIRAVTAAKSEANGNIETQRVLDGIIQRLTRAASTHSPQADLVTLDIGSSPNRMTLNFSTTTAPDNDDQRR